MKENIPLKQIPLPDYNCYRKEICANYDVTYPLGSFPPVQIQDLPLPLNSKKKGWPWDQGSELKVPPGKSLKMSVVVPSYQQGGFIEETIRSVLLQNYHELELIIIDGGSTDETTSVINHYKDFISLVIKEPDTGQSQAINKGFSMASGDLYCWLNSDDFLNINSLNKIADCFFKDVKLDIVYGDGLTLDEETGNITRDYAPLVLERYLRFGGIILSHSLVWRSRVHCPIWEDLQCAMDAELWLRLFTGRKVRHSLFSIGIARQHAAQKTSNNTKWEQKWKDDYEKYIWIWYPPVANWRLREYEFRLVQKLFKKYRDLVNAYL